MSKEIWMSNVKKLALAKGYERNTYLRDCSYEAGILVGNGELDRFKAIEKLSDAASKCKLAPNSWIAKVIRTELDKGLEAFIEVYDE